MKKVEKETNDLVEIVNLEEEKSKAKPYMEKFTKAKTFNSSRQEVYAENMAFYQGNQHILKKYKNDTPWVVNMNTPYATIAIDNRVSSILANDYIGELVPLSEEDVVPVEALDKVYKREWRRMDLDDVVRACIKGSAVVREFYCHITLDKNKSIGGGNSKVLGKLSAYAIEPARVFIDPTARNLKDANYMFVAGRISKEEAYEKYSKIKNLQGQSDSFTPSDRGEVYYDNDYVTEQDDVFQTLTYYQKENGKIKRVDFVNGIIINEKVLNRRTFPVTQLRWKKAAQSCYGLSLMDEVLSLQKAITSIESAITNTAMSYAAPSMMVRKGCGIDPKVVAKANGAPGVVYAVEGNLDNAMRPVIPPKIEQSIINIKADFQAQIDKITGNSSQFLGDIGTAGNTSSGATIAVERAKIIEIDVLNNIREFVEDTTEVIIEYIKQIYADETLTYNDGKKPDGSYNFTKIEMPDKDTLAKSSYKYEIELDTKTPYSKERQKELLLEIFRLERQYDTAVKTVTVGDVIKNMDLENKDEIIARLNTLSFQDAQTKAKVIEQMIVVGNENGVDSQLLNQAVAEVINNSKETPAVDQVMQILEQSFNQQVAENERKLESVSRQLLNTPGQQQMIQEEANMIENQGLMSAQ